MVSVKTLIIMRHAKADSGHPDRARPLAPRGRAQAAEIGGVLASRFKNVDKLWVSDAARTLQTLEGLKSGGFKCDDVSVEAQLYSAGQDDVLRFVRTSPKNADVVMVLGHEPTMTSTAAYLSDGKSQPGRDVMRGFPTGAAAIIELDGEWGDVDMREGNVVDFLRPHN